jgi:PTS system fructose-specific IIA component
MEVMMCNFISKDMILVKQNCNSRKEVLNLLAVQGVKLKLGVDESSVKQAFYDREKEGITGLENGFAIPHAKCSAIKRAGIVLIKLLNPIEWPTFDDTLVDIIIGLYVPKKEAGTTHIKLLSKVALLLMDEESQNFIRATNDPVLLANYFNEQFD